MKPATAALVLPLLALTWAAFAAQPVYRCGPDRSVYSQQPCADGAAVSVDDPRSAAQRADALAMHARQRRLAQDMAAQREQAAKAPAESAAGIAPAARASEPARAPRQARRTAKTSAEARRAASTPRADGFTAIVPGTGKRRPASPPAR